MKKENLKIKRNTIRLNMVNHPIIRIRTAQKGNIQTLNNDRRLPFPALADIWALKLYDSRKTTFKGP